MQAKKNSVICIIGMHRSGTSMITRLLNLCGLELGPPGKMMKPQADNPLGFYENTDFFDINEALLTQLGGSIYDLPVLKEDWESDPTLAPLADKARSLINTFPPSSRWGWKDPRNDILLPFWKLLISNLRFVICVRSPLEVASSLEKRDHIPFKKGVNLWRQYMQAALRNTEGYPRIFTFYEDFFIEGPNEISRMIDFCGLQLPDDPASLSDVIVPELKHHRSETGELLDDSALSAEDKLFYISLRALAKERPPSAHPDDDAEAFLSENVRKLCRLLHRFHDQQEMAQLQNVLADKEQELLKLHGRASEDDLRIRNLNEHVGNLKTHAENLIQHSDNLEKILADRDLLVKNLSEHVDNLENIHIKNLQDHTANLEKIVADRDLLVKNLSEHVDNLENIHIKNLQDHTANLEKIVADRDLLVKNLSEHVDNLENIHIKNLNVHAGNLENALAELRDFERKVKNTLIYKAYRFLRLHKIRRLPENDMPLRRAAVKSVEDIQVVDNSNARVLFISHDAYRTGAPMVLLHFIRWFKENTDVPFEILLKDGSGELREEFEELAPVMTWHQSAAETAGSMGIEQIKKHLTRAPLGLIYSNTITNGHVLAELSGLDCPTVCHVHELGYWINHKIEPQNLELIKRHTNQYIAVSQAVRKSLIENVKIPAENIDVVHEFIPARHDGLVNQSTAQKRIRKQLKLSEDALIIGACGTPDWRKGPDLFLQLARSVLGRRPQMPVVFIWVGGEVGRQDDGPLLAALRHDAQRAGLDPYVHFVGMQPNPLDYFGTFDVFALVSREDPFPIVNLEAASLGKPIVCFENSGGAPEFVEADCGFVVPYLDLDAMTDRVIELLSNAELRQQMGRRAATKVQERHDVTVAAPQILLIIQRFL